MIPPEQPWVLFPSLLRALAVQSILAIRSPRTDTRNPARLAIQCCLSSFHTQVHILSPIMIRHNPIQITRRMATQVRNVQIDEIRVHPIVHRVHHIHPCFEPRVLTWHYFRRIPILDQLVCVERVDWAELVDT